MSREAMPFQLSGIDMIKLRLQGACVEPLKWWNDTFNWVIMHSEDWAWSPLNVFRIWKYIEKSDPFKWYTLLKAKRRRPSTEMVVAYKNIHWKVRPFERKGLSKVRPFWKKKRRRPSTKTVVARNNTLKSQSLWKAFQKSDPFEWKKATTINKDGRRQKFFSNEHWKYPRKKIGKKKSNTRLSASVAQALFLRSFQTSEQRTNRRSKAYSQRIAAENCSNDHNTPIFN